MKRMNPESTSNFDRRTLNKHKNMIESDQEITVVHISDTHGLLVHENSIPLPPGDILIHSGDFSNRG